MKLASKEDIYRIDKTCEEKYGIPTLILMENAGEALFNAVKKYIPEYESKNYCVFCGAGNNGGDGAVLARKLFVKGFSVTVVMLDDINNAKGDALINFNIIQKLGVPFIASINSLNKIKKIVQESDVIIDAIFGIGFHGEIEGLKASIVDIINSSGKVIISADIPSGISADGKVSSHAIKANYTVTFGLPKIGMIDYPARNLTGKLITASINIPFFILEDPNIKDELITQKTISKIYRPRERNSHKGSYGHLLIIGGSQGKDGTSAMSGAVILAGRAALRAGCGLLTLAIPEKISLPIQKNFPEAIVFKLNDKEKHLSINEMLDLINKRKIKNILIGNGFGVGDFQKEIVEEILKLKNIDLIVIDADGLNILSRYRELMKGLYRKKGKIILTPHIGEMSRLIEKDTEWVKENKKSSALQLATELGCIVVLKDAVSVIALPNGKTFWNDSGSSSLAKGGSGDVLAGLISGLGSSGYSSVEACIMGTHLLGRAGEIYEEKFGAESALSSDIINILPNVFKEIYSSSPKTF